MVHTQHMLCAAPMPCTAMYTSTTYTGSANVLLYAQFPGNLMPCESCFCMGAGPKIHTVGTMWYTWAMHQRSMMQNNHFSLPGIASLACCCWQQLGKSGRSAPAAQHPGRHRHLRSHRRPGSSSCQPPQPHSLHLHPAFLGSALRHACTAGQQSAHQAASAAMDGQPVPCMPVCKCSLQRTIRLYPSTVYYLL